MTRLRGLCTNRDGSVSIIIPAQQCVDTLRDGGGISTAFMWRTGFRDWLKGFQNWKTIMDWWWADAIPIDIAKEWEVQKFICDPSWRRERSEAERRHLAERWIRALDQGGLSEREAVALIIEKDAPAYSTAHEIVNCSDLPQDRTYRDAWRRSHNGGPIYIDGGKQIEIEEAKAWEGYHGTKTA